MQMQIFIYLYSGALSKERYCSCSLSSEISFSWTLSFLKLPINYRKSEVSFYTNYLKKTWLHFSQSKAVNILPWFVLSLPIIIWNNFYFPWSYTNDRLSKSSISDFFWNFNDTDNAFILLLTQILSRSMKTSYYSYVKNSLIKILMTAVTHRQYKMIRHPVWKIPQRMEHMKVKPNRSSKVVDS